MSLVDKKEIRAFFLHIKISDKNTIGGVIILGKKLELAGKRFGRLVVMKEAGKDKHGFIQWRCKCDCGNVIITSGTSLKLGRTKSCGCFHKDIKRNMFIDLTGQKFERLTVVKRAKGYIGKGSYWHCKCDCGNEIIVRAQSLKDGQTKSCGCLNKELAIKRFTKHGHAQTEKQHPLYKAWVNMKTRCINPNSTGYEDYGGRGIRICQRWMDSFENFLEDMGEKPSPMHTLDRIDVNGDYCPGNCRWATQTTQSRNQRISKKNKSGIKGVSWSKKKQKWRASITINYKSIYLGLFDTIEEAAEARRKAELKLNKNNISKIGVKTSEEKLKERFGPEIENINNLLLNKVSISEIARRFKCARSTLRKVFNLYALNTYGMNVKKHKINERHL